jgi:hypothetical protein
MHQKYKLLVTKKKLSHESFYRQERKAIIRKDRQENEFIKLFDLCNKLCIHFAVIILR